MSNSLTLEYCSKTGKKCEFTIHKTFAYKPNSHFHQENKTENVKEDTTKWGQEILYNTLNIYVYSAQYISYMVGLVNKVYSPKLTPFYNDNQLLNLINESKRNMRSESRTFLSKKKEKRISSLCICPCCSRKTKEIVAKTDSRL